MLGAIIAAYDTNIGIGKMASCSNLSYSQLRKIKDNYLRKETLKRVIPSTWSHINLVGKYDFRKIAIPPSFSKIHELVKYDILVDEDLEEEDSAEMGLLN